MKIIIATLSTTHIDAHNHKMTLSALESIVEQIRQKYIPVGVEHDPRIPPQGRLIDAHIEKLEDGEYAVVGTLEFFEDGDEIQLNDTTRIIPMRHIELGRLEIGYDRAFQGAEDQGLIHEISEMLKNEPREELKKSIDPLAILTLTGAFIAGGIASGMLQAIGEDTYKAFKDKLKNLLGQNRREEQEQLFSFQVIVEVNHYLVEVQTIITNPTDEDIERFFEEGLPQLDDLLPRLFQTEQGVRKVVLEYSEGDFKIKFGLRRDAVPLKPSNTN